MATTTTTLRRSNDRKVTNAVTAGAGVKIANAFGLPSGKRYSCPGATSVCEEKCYAGNLENMRPAVRSLVLGNLEALQAAGTVEAMADLLQAMVDAFRKDCDNATRKGWTIKRAFRIHWDGDFFSTDYAMAWARVIAATPDVHFWVYTRSFTGTVDVMPIFDAMADRSNLSLYLSADRDNVTAAVAARKVYPWARWAWLAQTFADGLAEMPASDVKRYACPENAGRIELITPKGSACIRCGICPDARGDVIFSIGKR
jgi:hypothetical protein